MEIHSDFSTLKGKKILVVNTTSGMWFNTAIRTITSDLRKIQRQNFVIVGFPANNFGAQEPGTNQQICFCQKTMVFRFL